MNVTNSNSSAPVLDHRLKLVEQIVLETVFVFADLLVAFFNVLPTLIWKSTTTFLGSEILCRRSA